MSISYPVTLEELNRSSQYVYNVKRYGAIGDGTTDDTASIQSTINLALTTGGTVFMPNGDYAISSPLLLDTTVGKTLSIVGEGPMMSRLVRASSFSGSGILISNTDDVTNPTYARHLEGCTFRDFGIYCINGASRVDCGIIFPVIIHSRFERVWTSYAQKCGFVLDYNYSNKFDQCRADNCFKHGFVFGVQTEVNNQNTYTGCVSVGNSGVGYYLNGGHGHSFAGCNAELCASAGMYFNRVDGASIKGSYFESNAASGISFNTFGGGTLQGAPWVVKADIILNGTNTNISGVNYSVPLDVSRAFPTNGVGIEAFSYRQSGVAFIGFCGCEGININAYSAYSATYLSPDFLFNGSHTLATNINVGAHGSTNTKQNALSIYDVGRNYYPVPFTNVVIQDVNFPTLDITTSSLSVIEAGNGSGIYAPSAFTYRGQTLYRLGDTTSDALALSDFYGAALNLGEHRHLRGKYATFVVEWFPAFNYSDQYGGYHNGSARLVFNSIYNNNSILTATTEEVGTTGTITGGTNSLVVASAAGFKIGDFITVSKAGTGTNKGAHFTRITNISGTTFTLADNVTTSVTNETVRTSVPRTSYITILLPSSTENVYAGIQRFIGREDDAIYIAQMKIVPFGIQQPYMGE